MKIYILIEFMIVFQEDETIMLLSMLLRYRCLLLIYKSWEYNPQGTYILQHDCR